MGWALMLALALITGGLLWRFARSGPGATELIGAALLLGIAGYAWQGSPSLPGKPTPPPADQSQPMSEFEKTRGSMMERMGGDAQVLEVADAFHRQGLDNYAVGIIKGALSRKPNSADLWVGLGNALVLHSGGMMSPAAQLSFERAAKLNPEHPGPPFFMGLAYAQAGQTEKAIAIWRGLLDRSPPDAPWRKDLERRLSEAGAMGAPGQ